MSGWKCLQPEIMYQPGTRYRMTIPCNNCLGCESKWRKGWVLRMMLEAQSYAHVNFLTLTYEPGAEPMSLDYSDVVGYLKRLRRNSQAHVRFFCCGEYGDRGGRPHWHLITYTDTPCIPAGLSFQKEWPHGGALAVPANPATMAYVAGYSLKKRLEEIKVVMSRRPGIGLEKISDIGVQMASAVPEVPKTPIVMRIGKHLYPLHNRCREVLEQSYLSAGGRIITPPRSKLSMETESIIVLNAAVFVDNRRKADRAFQRLIITEKERGKTT